MVKYIMFKLTTCWRSKHDK